MLKGFSVCPDDIFDMHEVPALKPVPVDYKVFSCLCPLQKNRNNSCIWGFRILAGTVDIEIAQAGCSKSLILIKHPCQVLPVEFGNSIRRGRFRIHIFAFWKDRVVSVNSSRGCSYKFINPGFNAGLQYVKGPKSVCLLYTSPSPRDRQKSR